VKVGRLNCEVRGDGNSASVVWLKSTMRAVFFNFFFQIDNNDDKDDGVT
jgi:hypothetical protein